MSLDAACLSLINLIRRYPGLLDDPDLPEEWKAQLQRARFAVLGSVMRCHRCCARPATRETFLKATWVRLCEECWAKDADPASFVPPDGRMLTKGAP